MLLNKEQMRSIYTGFSEERDEQIVNSPDFLQYLAERGSYPFPTDNDLTLKQLEAYVHCNGFFFWHHFEEDESGGDQSIYTLEEIKPTGTFDIPSAETRFNEMEQTFTDQTPRYLLDEQIELEHEARRNGLTFKSDIALQRYTCIPLPKGN